MCHCANYVILTMRRHCCWLFTFPFGPGTISCQCVCVCVLVTMEFFFTSGQQFPFDSLSLRYAFTKSQFIGEEDVYLCTLCMIAVQCLHKHHITLAEIIHYTIYLKFEYEIRRKHIKFVCILYLQIVNHHRLIHTNLTRLFVHRCI